MKKIPINFMKLPDYNKLPDYMKLPDYIGLPNYIDIPKQNIRALGDIPKESISKPKIK